MKLRIPYGNLVNIKTKVASFGFKIVKFLIPYNSTSTYILDECWMVFWLIVDYLLLRDFGPYGIKFMNVCVVITVAMVMLLRDFGPCGKIFMTMCLLL
jgi:hypothetical protein